MGSRWIQKEAEALAEVKSRLKDQLASRPQYPDVIGDRRLVRFLRAKQNDANEATKMFSAFLKWRDEYNVDDIRNQILYGGLDTPLKFPNGKKIIELAPQIIISAQAKDFKGQPLVLEQYSFSPGDLLSRVTIKDYLLFLIYSLEYRALVMEQMSHELETQYLATHPNPEDREDGYGVVLLNFCIRDLQGVGISHLTGKGKSVIEAAINIGLPNYPEYLGKCHMVNVPWIFTSMWFFIKGLLDDFILAKINLTGSKFIDTLLKDVPIESIPKALGGKFELYNESYAFDTSPGGPFYCPSLLKPAPLSPTTSMAAFSTPNVSYYPDDVVESEVEDVMTGKRLSMHIDSTGRPASPMRTRPNASIQQTSPSAGGTEVHEPSPSTAHVMSTPERAPANRAPTSDVSTSNGSGQRSSQHHNHGTPGAAIPTLLTTSSPAAHTTPPHSTHPSSSSSTPASAPAAVRATTPVRSHPIRMPSLSSMLGRSPTQTEAAPPAVPVSASGAPSGGAASGPSVAPADQSEKAKLIGALRAQKLTITSPNTIAPQNSLAFPAVETTVQTAAAMPVAHVVPSLTIVSPVAHVSAPLLSPQQSSLPAFATSASGAAVSSRRLHTAPVVNISPRSVAKELDAAQKMLAFALQYPVEVALACTAVIVSIMLDLWSAWRYVVLPMLMYIFVVHVL